MNPVSKTLIINDGNREYLDYFNSFEHLHIVKDVETLIIDYSTPYFKWGTTLNGLKLKSLKFNGHIDSLYLGIFGRLHYLKCSGIGLSELILNSEIDVVDCSDNNLKKLKINSFYTKSLKCNNNKIQTLIINECSRIEHIDASFNNIKDFDFSFLEKLKKINLSYNYIREIKYDICNQEQCSFFKSLENLNLYSNPLKEINIGA